MMNPFKFLFRTFYEGAKRTVANRDFYNTNSSFEQTAAPDRATLKARSRWLSENNPIMSNIDNAIINNTIGTGITLQLITDNDNFNKDIEARFKRWSKSPSMCDSTGRLTFGDMQRSILKSRMVDGEIFVYKRMTPDGLKLQLIESDTLDGTRQDGGLEMGADGAVKNYHFQTENNQKFVVDAKQIINYYMSERPSQYRGVSEYKQAILDIKNFSAFQTASIQGARARANIGYYVKSSGGIASFGADVNEKVQEVNGVKVLYLNSNEDLGKLDPDSVATDYVQFSESTIRLMATARCVSYELSYRDYSKVNFASSRASIIQDNKRFDHEQVHLTDYILNDVFQAWFEVELTRGTIKAPQYDKDPFKYLATRWIMPVRVLVDPLKEVTALEKQIALNLTTETEACLANGNDYEEVIAQKAKEIALKEQYGIPDYTLIEVETEDSGKVDYDDNMTGAESSVNEKTSG